MSNSEIERLLITKVKKTAILILTFSFAALALTGCNEQLGNGSELLNSGIEAPVVMEYTVSNPLICEEVIEGNGQEFDYRYIKVSGLADKEVEKAINDRIKAVYDELRVQDIPPYRGIKVRIPENFTLLNEAIYVNVTGNFNNILSIMLSKSATYHDPAFKANEKDPAYYETSRYFSETETLNFNLKTGEEINLPDLFCDNVDAMKLVNEYMTGFLSENYAEDEGYYMGSFSELKLVEAFKGLTKDQRFAIYPYGIAFVFDYRTPQFDTGNVSVCPLIFYSEFGDNIAVAERWYNEKENIFTSKEPLVKSFVMKNSKNDIVGNDYFQQGNVNIYQSWSYSSKLPEEIREQLDQMRVIDKDKVKEIEQIYSTLPQSEIEQRGPGAYEIMVYGDWMGNYINVSQYSNIYLSDYYEQVLDFRCYDAKTLEELKLEDIFKEGYDYKPVILNAVRNAIDSYDGTYDGTGENSGGRYSDQQYEEVFDRIGGFNLSSDSLNIPVLHPDKGTQTYGLTVYIPYKDIGCNNMTIFD